MMFVRSAIFDGSGCDEFVNENRIGVSVGQGLTTPRYHFVGEELQRKQFDVLGSGYVMRFPVFSGLLITYFLFSLVFSSLISFLFLVVLSL